MPRFLFLYLLQVLSRRLYLPALKAGVAVGQLPKLVSVDLQVWWSGIVLWALERRWL